MKQFNDPDWNEQNDPEIVDWKRVRSSIEHENTLTTARFSWLLTSQGFLLGGFVLLFQGLAKADGNWTPKFQVVLAGLALAGILMSVLLSRGLRAAHDQHKRLEHWWKNRPKDDEGRHPPICGNEPKIFRTLQYYKFPIVFVVAWVILLLAVLYDHLVKYQTEVALILVVLVLLIGAGTVGYWLGRKPNGKSG